MSNLKLDEPIHSFYSVTPTLKERVFQDNLHASGTRGRFEGEEEVGGEEEDVEFEQPKRWWFASTVFPLIAGTFGPLGILFSLCALVQPWRTTILDGEIVAKGKSVEDPSWLLVLNSISFASALAANVILLLNFAHRIRYSIAQPFTIMLWYIAALLLIVPLGLSRYFTKQSNSTLAFAQSYYYAVISATIHTIISSLLVFNAAGAYVFKAYPPFFNSLTIPQRTLILQTISYAVYLALGAAAFSAIEGWHFTDALYWADYTLLTIGLGSDFPLRTTLGRAFVIPYAACGITMIGLIIGSVRMLVLERAKMKVIRRNLLKQRQTHMDRTEKPHEGWEQQEFESMRRIEHKAETVQQYTALLTSLFACVILWLGGALAFWHTEAVPQKWTYFEALYFAYTTLLTIGYGDFYPQSNSGKPFLVVWSLLAVPTVTVLISNMGDTVVRGLKRATLWLGKRTIFPEREKRLLHRSKEWESEKRPAKDKESYSENTLGVDVERLGEAIEIEEEERGRGSSLAAKIARQISDLAKDVGRMPPRKYEWHEWKIWLDLLGMQDGRQLNEGRTRTDSGGPSRNQKNADWTWLSNDGPLFSRVSETEWVLGKLCIRLEEVLGKELEDASKRQL